MTACPHRRGRGGKGGRARPPGVPLSCRAMDETEGRPGVISLLSERPLLGGYQFGTKLTLCSAGLSSNEMTHGGGVKVGALMILGSGCF